MVDYNCYNGRWDQLIPLNKTILLRNSLIYICIFHFSIILWIIDFQYRKQLCIEILSYIDNLFRRTFFQRITTKKNKWKQWLPWAVSFSDFSQNFWIQHLSFFCGKALLQSEMCDTFTKALLREFESSRECEESLDRKCSIWNVVRKRVGDLYPGCKVVAFGSSMTG